MTSDRGLQKRKGQQSLQREEERPQPLRTRVVEGSVPSSSVCVLGVPTPPGRSVTPAGCPTLQLGSQAVYLEAGSGPSVQGLSPKDRPPTSDASHRRRLCPGLLTNGRKREAPTGLLGFSLFARAGPRAQRSSMLTRSPLDYKRV